MPSFDSTRSTNSANPHADRERARQGFTLVELLVVVTLVVALMALLMPEFQRAREMARRAVCASNQRQIAVLTLGYAVDNNGEFIFCARRFDQSAFTTMYDDDTRRNTPKDETVDHTKNRFACPYVIKSLVRAGLVAASKPHPTSDNDYEPLPIWNCPSLDYKSHNTKSNHTIRVAYQYFGGIRVWESTSGFKWSDGAGNTATNRSSRSPLNIRRSDPSWCLTADLTVKLNNVWATKGQGLPPHHLADSSPEGQNESFVDGSVQWVKGTQLLVIHSYNPQDLAWLFYQRDLGPYKNPPTMAKWSYWH